MGTGGGKASRNVVSDLASSRTDSVWRPLNSVARGAEQPLVVACCTSSLPVCSYSSVNGRAPHGRTKRTWRRARVMATRSNRRALSRSEDEAFSRKKASAFFG